MPWEILIIPLIAFGVWLLGTIFRGAEENPRQARARNERDGEGRTRRSAADLDRFLQDARRRREERQNSETPEVKPVEPEPVARPAPPPPVRRANPRRQAPRQRPAQPVPVAIPEPPRRVVADSPPPAPTPRPVVLLELAPESASPPPPPPPKAEPAVAAIPLLSPLPIASNVQRPRPIETKLEAKKQAVPPAIAILGQLLRSPQNMGAAFLLREVLDAPLSIRKPAGR